MNDDIGKTGADILIVDDAPEDLRLLSEMFKGLGYKVRVATGGAVALEAAGHAPPDLVLLDVKMPDLDGYEVCRRLKADEKLREVPVIFLSALTGTADKVKAFTAGGADYVCKPFQYDEVRARVETQLRLLEQKRRLRESYEKLREMEKVRDGLVHILAHDLRALLAPIGEFLSFTKNGARCDLTAKGADNISQTLKMADEMIKMVNELLEASKTERAAAGPAEKANGRP